MLAIHFSVFGQHVCGLKASGGLSKISTTADTNLTINKDCFAFSGAGGLYYNMRLKKSHLFGAELLFVLIRGKERSEVYESGQAGNLSGHYSINDTWRNVSYFGIPIYYGFKYKKLNINLGFQTLFTMKSKSRSKGLNGQNSVSVPYESRINMPDIATYNYGPRAGAMYYISKKISVEAIFYYGINTIYSAVNDKWRARQITIGIRYQLFYLEPDPKKLNAILE